MYSLKIDGNEIALTNEMRYIRMQSNGAYGLCGKQEADGVAADNKVYHFDSDIDTVEYFDGQAAIEEILTDTETTFAILKGEI